MPYTCSSTSTRLIMNEFMNNVNYELKYYEHENGYFKDPCYDGIKEEWAAAQRTIVIFFSILVILVILSTIYEFYNNSTHQLTCGIFTAFSLFKNFESLLEINLNRAEFTRCLNGLNVFSIAWIVFINVYNYYNKVPAMFNKDEVQSYPATTLDLPVVTFFVIGGMVLTQNYMKTRQKKEKFQYLKHLLHKLFQFAPAYLLIIILILSFLQILGNGPVWWSVDMNLVGACRKNLLSSLIFIQNWGVLDYCNPPTVYISIIAQLYLISPVILILLWKYGNRVAITLCINLLISTVIVLVLTLVYEFNFSFNSENYVKWIKYATWVWFPPWAIGIILGYILVRGQNSKLRVPQILQWIIWILVPVLMVVIVIFPTQIIENVFQNQSVLSLALYKSLYKLIWSLCIGWIIFSCVNGQGGVINWFLSFDILQPLARLSYCVFLIHYPIIVITQGLQRTPSYFSIYMVFHEFIAVYGISLLSALVLNLIIVSPVLNIEATIYRIIKMRRVINK